MKLIRLLILLSRGRSSLRAIGRGIGILPDKCAIALLAMRRLGIPHRSSNLHCRRDATRVEVDLHADFAGEVEIPVYGADEETAADHVSERGGDHAFPDVVAYAYVCTDEDAHCSVMLVLLWTHESWGCRDILGTKNMFATTWSRASATKVAVGHQIAMILLEISLLLMLMKTAKHTLHVQVSFFVFASYEY